MILKDVIQEYGHDNVTIMYRTNYPDESIENNSMLFGYCAWQECQLISLDGDSYSLDDEIIKWETYTDYNDTECICVYIYSDWLTGADWNKIIEEERNKQCQ